MSSAVRAGTYTSLGWRWASVNGSGTAHLVPARPGRLSRTACNRCALADARITEPLLSVPHCGRCEELDR